MLECSDHLDKVVRYLVRLGYDLHIYVGQLESRLSEIPHDRPITIVCNVGHRASLAASILLRAGYPNVCCDVLGSTGAWRASKFPMTKE